MNIQENISLQSYNTLAVPAKTRWFIAVDNIQGLQQALAFYRQQREVNPRCPLLILGGGSNIVLADDFPGVCVHIGIQGRQIESETADNIFLSVAAGESWHKTVMFCVDQGYYGIENLALIPGSVGAAPIQNIGAYGVELNQCLAYVEIMDIETGELSQLTCQECEFAYRDSIFKHRLHHRVVITRIVLALHKQPRWVLDYPALKAALPENAQLLSLKNVADTVIAIRQSKLPDPQSIPNAGSFFKNPIVNPDIYQQLQQDYPQLIAYPHEHNYKLAAGWLLDHAGWRGKDINGFSMHKDQALVLTNPRRQSGEQLLAFVAQVKADIKAKYSLDLEVEPRIISAHYG